MPPSPAGPKPVQCERPTLGIPLVRPDAPGARSLGRNVASRSVLVTPDLRFSLIWKETSCPKRWSFAA